MNTRTLKNATVVTCGRDQKVVENGKIVIEDGEIIEVADSTQEIDSSAEIIDLKGKVVIPGLINSHSHMEISSIEDILEEQSSNQTLLETLPIVQDIWDGDREELIKSGYEYGCYNFIKNGITTVNTMDYRPEVGADIIKSSGMRAVIGHVGTDLFLKTDTEEVIEREKAFLEEYRDSEMITPSISTQGDFYCSKSFWNEISELRTEYPEVPFHTHVFELPESRQMSKINGAEGTSQLLDELGLLNEKAVLAHFTHAKENDYQAFEKNSVGLAHCPSVLEAYDYNETWPQVEKADKRGIKMGIGLDDHYIIENDNLFDETRKVREKMKEQRDYSISPESLFRKMTLEGAKAVGLGEATGSIEEGKKADLVVLDIELDSNKNTFAQVIESTPEKVEHVFIDGEHVLENKKVQTIDREKMLERKNEVETEMREELDQRFLNTKLLIRTLSIIDLRVLKLIPHKLKNKL